MANLKYSPQKKRFLAGWVNIPPFLEAKKKLYSTIWIHYMTYSSPRPSPFFPNLQPTMWKTQHFGLIFLGKSLKIFPTGHRLPPARPRHHHQPLVPLRGDQQRPRRAQLEGSRFEGQGGEDLESATGRIHGADGSWLTHPPEMVNGMYPLVMTNIAIENGHL